MSTMKQIEARETADNVHAVVVTNNGTFKIELFHRQAPKTVQNFIDLAEGHERDGAFYDGLAFHRIIQDFMIQGGCPDGTGMGGPGHRFADEFHPELNHVGPGYLSMANAGPNTNGSQFFITLVPTPHLDGRHAVFGKVVDGLDVVMNIGNVPTGYGDKPVEPVVMESVSIERS